MKVMSTKKMIIGAIALFVIFLMMVALLPHSKKTTVAAVIKQKSVVDNASGDTPIETIKTLTEHVSAVEAQNKLLQEHNNAFQTDQSMQLSQFKESMQQSLSQLQAAIAAQKAAQKGEAYSISNAHAMTWVDDLQAPPPAPPVSPSTNSTAQTASWNTPTAPAMEPYYTLPVNATLTGAVAMQPIIGRIPINGQVPDPYHFKVIIGSKNLAANGVDIPSDVAGIVASGVASGDMLGSCARGRITSMTFVFQDGTISTTQSTDNEGLGEIAASNGNPCIQGEFHTNAPAFLGGTVLLAGAQGYANALSQAQTMTSTPTAATPSITTIIGNSGTYAAGQAASSAAQAAQAWWQARAQNSFDYVFVPNVDKQGAFLKLNINVTQSIAIDYNSAGRKIVYEKNSAKTSTTKLD